jgi:hypothetical protein
VETAGITLGVAVAPVTGTLVTGACACAWTSSTFASSGALRSVYGTPSTHIELHTRTIKPGCEVPATSGIRVGDGAAELGAMGRVGVAGCALGSGVVVVGCDPEHPLAAMRRIRVARAIICDVALIMSISVL